MNKYQESRKVQLERETEQRIKREQKEKIPPAATLFKIRHKYLLNIYYTLDTFSHLFT